MHGTVRAATLADRIGSASATRDLFLILGASFGVGLLAQLEIRLP